MHLALLATLSTIPRYNSRLSQPPSSGISLISEKVNYLFLELGCIQCFSHLPHHTPLSLLYTVIAASPQAQRCLVYPFVALPSDMHAIGRMVGSRNILTSGVRPGNFGCQNRNILATGCTFSCPSLSQLHLRVFPSLPSMNSTSRSGRAGSSWISQPRALIRRRSWFFEFTELKVLTNAPKVMAISAPAL
jgi:hypothetical protein